LDSQNHSRQWVAAAVSLTALASLACAVLPRGLALTAISDLVCALLMLSALLAFASNGVFSNGRTRLFWVLQAAGWGLWLSDQVVWIFYDLVVKRQMPAMHPADALLFTAQVPMLAGLLLRPHLKPSEPSTRLGALDFLLLLLWWLYLYQSFVMCWQYISPAQPIYDRNYDLLFEAEEFVLLAVLGLFWYQSSGHWRRFYARFFGAMLCNSLAFALLNRAIEKGMYFTGSWYDLPYAASFSAFTAVALFGRGLLPTAESRGERSYDSWIANLAMIAVLSLPVLAVIALLNKDIPSPVARFRILVTLGTMFAMAFLLFVKHYRLNQELKRSNSVLEEASLTDPLTGVRNRRYFTATIDADVSQSMRSYADSHDPRTRDLLFYLIDADNFKEINDRYGHDAGDRVLVEMARRISSSIRHSDVLVRWGGEEFLIVSRYTDRREAEILAGRVLAAVGGTPFALGSPDETIYRTCSIGWAAFPWFPGDPAAVDYEEILTLADRGLNQAKRSGKNSAIGILPAPGQPLSNAADGVLSDRFSVEVLATAGPSPNLEL
jgi:diguanylate cyclase (GGDEF)-like protein